MRPFTGRDRADLVGHSGGETGVKSRSTLVVAHGDIKQAFENRWSVLCGDFVLCFSGPDSRGPHLCVYTCSPDAVPRMCEEVRGREPGCPGKGAGGLQGGVRAVCGPGSGMGFVSPVGARPPPVRGPVLGGAAGKGIRSREGCGDRRVTSPLPLILGFGARRRTFPTCPPRLPESRFSSVGRPCRVGCGDTPRAGLRASVSTPRFDHNIWCWNGVRGQEVVVK